MIDVGVGMVLRRRTPVRCAQPVGQQVGPVREVEKPAQVSVSQRATSLAK